MMENNNNTANVSSNRVYTKVKRGMVFWYDSNPRSNNREVVPTISVRDKSYRDNIVSGSRPWVVVSSDYINRQNRVVTVVPMSLDSEKVTEDETKVGLFFLGKKTYVLCEQIRTINNAELSPDKYASSLEEETMEKIDRVMIKTLSIKEQEPVSIEKLISERSMEKLEGVINAIVQKRVVEAKRQMEIERSQSQIDDAVLRITQGLADMYDITVPDTSEKVNTASPVNSDSVSLADISKSVVDSVEDAMKPKKVSVIINRDKSTDGSDGTLEAFKDFRKKYIDNGDGYYNGDNYHIDPKHRKVSRGIDKILEDSKVETVDIEPVRPAKTVKSVSKTVKSGSVNIGTLGHREFTREMVDEFMADYSTMEPTAFCKKWGYKNRKSASQMRSNLVKKFGLDRDAGKRVSNV